MARKAPRATRRNASRRKSAWNDGFSFNGDSARMVWYDDFAIDCDADRMPDGTWRVVYTLMDPLDTDGATGLSRLGRFDVDLSGHEYEEDALRDFMEDNIPPVPQADRDRYSLRDIVGYIMNGYGGIGTIETRKDVADAYMSACGSLPSDDELDEIVNCINDNYFVHIESKTGGKRMVMRNDMRRESAYMESFIGKYGDADGYVLISRDGSLGMPRFVRYLGQLDALVMDYDTGDEDRLERLTILESDVEENGYGECKDPDLVAYAVSCDWSKTTPRTSRRNMPCKTMRGNGKASRRGKGDTVRTASGRKTADSGNVEFSNDILESYGLTIDDILDNDSSFQDEWKAGEAIDTVARKLARDLRDDPELLGGYVAAYDDDYFDKIARVVAKDVVWTARYAAGASARWKDRGQKASMRKGAGFHSIPGEFGGGWIETDEVEPGRWRARGSQGGEYATMAVYGRTEQEAVQKAVKEMQGYPVARDLTLGDVMGAEACRSASRRGAATRRSPAKRRASRANAVAKSARARRIAAYGRKNRGGGR